jgi:hypothetical protein
MLKGENDSETLAVYGYLATCIRTLSMTDRFHTRQLKKKPSTLSSAATGTNFPTLPPQDSSFLPGIIGAVVVPVVTRRVLGDTSVLNTGTWSRAGYTAGGCVRVLISIGIRRSGIGLGVVRVGRGWTGRRSNSLVTGIGRLAVLVILVGTGCAMGSANPSLLRSVAIAHVGRSGVGGKGVCGIGHGGGVSLTAEAEETTALAAVSAGVVVSWTGAESLLLAVVADQSDFDKGREEEEQAGDGLALYTRRMVVLGYSHSNNGNS